MASSSSSSVGSQISWVPTSKALWVLQDPAMDDNGAFKGTLAHFEARLEALKASGVAVTSQVFELFEKVVDYIQSAYPHGIDLLGFRMHASEKSLPLSGQEGGSYSLEKPEEGLEAIKDLFSRVRKFVMIEGCQTGSGKNGILKYVVRLCNPGVVGIGSKGSQFEVGFDPILPGYMRFECLESKQDITRIYYKTENGGVQNIQVDELMLLWDFLKESCGTPEEKQRGFELCYKLLGERNDPAVFSRIRVENKTFIDSVLGSFEPIREKLLQVKVNKLGTKAIWTEMLGGLEALSSEFGGDRENPEILVDEDERAKTSDQIVTDEGLRVDSWTPYQKVYRFLLGCAFIDKYKPLLMLLDDETRYGPASQGIKALSGLTIHGSDTQSITSMLAYYFPIIKNSYLAGKNSYLLKQWFEGISKGVCFNNMIKFIDDFYEERIRPSKEERLRVAILQGDGEEVQKLIEQGVDLNSPEIEIGTVLFEAIDRGYLFISFLLLEQLQPEEASRFMNDLRLEHEKHPKYTELGEQIALISKHLVRKGNIERAVDYAKLIDDPELQLNVLCECANSAAVLGHTVKALEIVEMFTHSTAPIYFQSDKAKDQRSAVIYQIVKIALKLGELAEVLKMGALIPRQNIRRNAGSKLFNAMMKKRTQDEVITFLSASVFGSFMLYNRVQKLLIKYNYDQALKIADAIKYPNDFDNARSKIVRWLIAQCNFEEAFAQVIKIGNQFQHDFLLVDIMEFLMRNLDLQARRGGGMEQMLDCFKHIKDHSLWADSSTLMGFLYLELFNPNGELKFIGDLMSKYQTTSDITPKLDEQVGFILKYLIGKGEVVRAFGYAKFIKDPHHQLNMINECALAAVALGDLALVQETEVLYNAVQGKIKILENKGQNVRKELKKKKKSIKNDLEKMDLAKKRYIERSEKAEKAFVSKAQRHGISDLTLEEFKGICRNSNYEISVIPSYLLNKHTIPKIKAVIKSHLVFAERSKRIDEKVARLEKNLNKVDSKLIVNKDEINKEVIKQIRLQKSLKRTGSQQDLIKWIATGPYLCSDNKGGGGDQEVDPWLWPNLSFDD